MIVDHLTPPLTRAESYGELRELERLLDEYHVAAELDPRRLRHLRSGNPRATAARLGLDRGSGARRATADDRAACAGSTGTCAS